MSTVGWQAEMELEGATMIEEAELLHDLTLQQLPAPFQEDFQHLHSCTDPCSNRNTICSSSPVLEAPTNKSITEAAASSDLVCFNYSTSKNSESKAGSGCKSTTRSSKKSSHSKEHVIGKRKRLVKHSQQFRELTAIVHGIERMDETIVLDNSIKYLKQMQERVKTLEEQTCKKTTESVVIVKKLHNHSDSDENFTDEPEPLHQIEARVCNRNVLIRICSEIRKGVLVKALEEAEKLNLSVVNSSVIPFGASLEITLVAQMDDEFKMSVKDLVKSLRSSLIQFMGRNLPREHDN